MLKYLQIKLAVAEVVYLQRTRKYFINCCI